MNSTRHYGLETNGQVTLTTTTTPNAGVLGRIFPYKSYGLGVTPIPASETERWVYALGIIYTNQATTTIMKKYTAVHEYGHILSQAHVSGVNSVMVQGVYALFAPTSYDKTSLIQKWGR